MGKRGQSTLRRVGSSIIFPVYSKRMHDKGMTSVSIKARSVAHDKSWIKGRYKHHQWNSGSMQARYTFIGFFCLIILQERCTTNLDLFCYGYDHQHRELSLNRVGGLKASVAHLSVPGCCAVYDVCLVTHISFCSPNQTKTNLKLQRLD